MDLPMLDHLARTRLRLGLLLGFCFALHAADKGEPLNLKAGLWQVTTTTAPSGDVMVPAALLEKLTLEQRARVQDRIETRKSEPEKTTVKRQCLTRKHLDDGIPLSPDLKSCTRTVLTSTRRKVDMHVECVEKGIKSDGTFQIEALSSENVKGSIRLSATSGYNAANSTSTFTARWIGPSCSTTK
jgi:hypothetical protein